MTSVTQRIMQYNQEPRQPRGGLFNPKLLTATQLDDEQAALDHKLENIHASIVGLAVDYLSRLARINANDAQEAARQAANVFRASVMGAERISEFGGDDSIAADAKAVALGFEMMQLDDGTVKYVIDVDAVHRACRLSMYDVGLRAGVVFYNLQSTQLAPDEVTTVHVLAMVERAAKFFEQYGPVTKDGFVFVSEDEHAAGGRGGYTDLVESGDGDFLTADTLWDFKVSASKPTKDHTLQLLMYFLMGKQSGLPEFEDITSVGIFNPRLNIVYHIETRELPADVIDTVRRDVIGYDA